MLVSITANARSGKLASLSWARTTRELRDRQRDRLCDALSAVPADAPTLCEGWDAHDLAVHIWVIKHEPLAWPGMVVRPLAPTSAALSDRIKRRWDYHDLIRRIRCDKAGIACMPFDRREDYRHSLGEYFVHTQDVARPNGVEQPVPDPQLQDALWLRVQLAAHQLHRRRIPGLVLQRPSGERAQVTEGPIRRVVSGEPSELMCWVYSRRGADVELSDQG